MRERPVTAPELPGERVDVLEDCGSDGCVADVGDYVVRFYGEGLEESC